MQLRLATYLLFVLMAGSLTACNNPRSVTHLFKYRGVYSFDSQVKSFKDCDNGREFWVTDSLKQLEAKYAQLNSEKPYEPVYVEVEGRKIKSGKEGLGAEYDSTLVVKSVMRITKAIPQDLCN